MKDIYKRISLILKKLRKDKGWSLDKTAEMTGVSKAMLGQIEREESSPTIATLWKIASGFNTSFSSFLETFEPLATETIRRSAETKELKPTHEKMRVIPLFPFDSTLNCEIYIIELAPGYEHLSPPHKHGVIEHVIVTEGKMEVLINDKWQTLAKNEGIRFKANIPHGYRNRTKRQAQFHNIIHYGK